MADNHTANVGKRLQVVNKNIEKAMGNVSIQSKLVTLVAVSKTFSGEAIVPVLDAGQRVFGENRVQEAAAKWPQLIEKYDGVILHLIGPLQTNKTATAVQLFDCIETLDRPKLARSIALEMEKQRKTVELFVQVNIGAELQKAGVLVLDLPALLDLCRIELKLNISGLMCIPPVDEDPNFYFTKLVELARQNGVENLSMGMSADYELAIESGATHVRVGSAIFGRR